MSNINTEIKDTVEIKVITPIWENYDEGVEVAEKLEVFFETLTRNQRILWWSLSKAKQAGVDADETKGLELEADFESFLVNEMYPIIKEVVGSEEYCNDTHPIQISLKWLGKEIKTIY